ncbi:MAG: hypothetical protein ACE5F2_02500 [Candidatus Paceibacteria bacterium]
MENFKYSEEKAREEASELKEKAQEIAGEGKEIETEHYRKAEQLIENLLAEATLTSESEDGNLDVKLENEKETQKDLIEYEFELEEEQRKKVKPEDYEIEEWQNHVIDTYDQSGRCRIRDKNGKLRLSLKVPLFSRDTEHTKCCIRLEFKPVTEQQEKTLNTVRELIKEEPATIIHEKWGTPLKLTNGEKIWINKDQEGNYWVETDEDYDLKEVLPKGIKYLGTEKSKINVKETAETSNTDFNTFNDSFKENINAVSRTAKGISDTSVSEEKVKLSLEKEKLAEQVDKNTDEIIKYIWENKERKFESAQDIKNLFKEVVSITNNKLTEKEPDTLRTWDTGYGRKVSYEELDNEMERFYQVLLEKEQEVASGKLKIEELAPWIELEIDRHLHPYADGCGRVAKAISNFFLARYDHKLPNYSSREEYYKAMNSGDEKQDEEFLKYYRKAFQRA